MARGRGSKASGPRWRARAKRLVRRIALWVLVAATLLTVVPLAYLRFGPPWFSAFMLRSHFADPATGERCDRVDYRYVPWDAIARPMRRAVVIAEDQRFLSHHGFDLDAIGAALGDRLRGKPLRGASTITQQLAKNLFLWPGRDVGRKAVEVWYTGWIELTWPKRRILELYLNVAQFGPCRFGVEAASRHFFGTAAHALGVEEAARLAAALPSPARIRVADPGPYAQRRSREIEEQIGRTQDAAWLRGI